MKLISVAMSVLPHWRPESMAPLADIGTGSRVLARDSERELVLAAQADPARAAQIDAERAIAPAVLAALGGTALKIPEIVDTISSTAGALGLSDYPGDHPVQVVITKPLPGAKILATDLDIDAELQSSAADVLTAFLQASIDPLIAAGLPEYDAVSARARHLANLDRAAETGKVPSILLDRWERILDEAGLWRFSPVLVHGTLSHENFLVEGSRIVALTDLSSVRISDPAENFSWLAALQPETAHRIVSAVDQNVAGVGLEGLSTRIDFLAEMALVEWLLAGVDVRDGTIVTDAQAMLQELAETYRVPETVDSPAPPGAEPDDTVTGSHALGSEKARSPEPDDKDD